MKIRDLKGQQFGRLIALEVVGKDKHRSMKWKCRCQCGKDIVALSGNLIKGTTQSCGCLQAELTSARSKTHGRTGTSEYNIYQAMIRRCYKPKTKEYPRYGGRGIIICDRWLNSFENFFEDMGEKPSNYHSLDRENVNGNYEPSNCRWATKRQQAGNRRYNVWVEFNGKRQIVADWARELNIHPDIITRRFKKGLPLNVNENEKIILDTETGIFYYSCKEAALSKNMLSATLSGKLTGFRTNNTSLKYV